MQYFVNKKNIKQSVSNLGGFLKEKGYDIPRNILLDAFSKSIFFKNYNTLEGMCSQPTIIAHLPSKRAYMIEVEASISPEDFKEVFKLSLQEGKCEAHVDNFIFDNNTYHLEISFPKTTDNFLIAMFYLASYLKKYQVKRFDLLRIIFEKESLLEAVKLELPAKNI